MEEYDIMLAEHLDQKHLLIREFQSRRVEFKRQLNKE